MLSWPVFPTDSSSDPEAFDRDRVHSADDLHHSEACFSGSQRRDPPAGTGERENDEEIVDDRAVKFSPCRLEDGAVPSVRFFSSGFGCSLSTTCKCALRVPRPLGLWVKPTSGLTFIGKVTLCLLSMRVFLLLSVFETGCGKPRRRKMGKPGFFVRSPRVCVYE